MDVIFFADHALSKGCYVIRVYRIKYTVLIMNASEEKLKVDVAASMFVTDTNEHHTVALIILLHFRPASLDVTRQLIEQAIHKWPDSERLKKAASILRSCDQECPDDPDEHLKLIAEGLNRVEQDLPTFMGLGASFLKLKTADFTRPLITKYDPSGLVLTENAGTGDVMVFFKGVGANVSTIETTDAYASTAGMSAVYLEDSSRLFFCNGAPVLGPDLDSSLSALKKLVDGFGPRRSLTIVSTSAGVLVRCFMVHTSRRIVSYALRPSLT